MRPWNPKSVPLRGLSVQLTTWTSGGLPVRAPVFLAPGSSPRPANGPGSTNIKTPPESVRMHANDASRAECVAGCVPPMGQTMGSTTTRYAHAVAFSTTAQYSVRGPIGAATSWCATGLVNIKHPHIVWVAGPCCVKQLFLRIFDTHSHKYTIIK